MKFIADAMLGRLAKWLRLAGFDVLYYRDIDDSQVVRIAREQERTIITRDTQLLRRTGLQAPIFIVSDHVAEQLAELRGRLDRSDAEPLGRCMLCNTALSVVDDRSMVRNAVPEYVYHRFEKFSQCATCGRVYWEGSHFTKIRERLCEVLQTPCSDDA
jgi:uncharacterized protein with PIN domain